MLFNSLKNYNYTSKEINRMQEIKNVNVTLKLLRL